MKHSPFKIEGPEDLVTSKEETRAGFIQFALEKNRRSTPYIQEAKVFRHMALQAKTPYDLLNIPEIRAPLLTASGLSDKSLKFLTDADKNHAVEELIKNFLEPEGEHFVDEVVFRFLLIRGDSLGGSMRNIVGLLAQQKLIRTLVSILKVRGISYRWTASNGRWIEKTADDYNIEETLKAIQWEIKGERRTLAFNLKIPVVKNNVDICLFNCDTTGYSNGKVVNSPEKILLLGELKGGIDPAGADEHWKTANTALGRIRNAFNLKGLEIKTSFIAAAIEQTMATEIWSQLQSGELNYAANITKEDQVIEYCNWLLKI